MNNKALPSSILTKSQERTFTKKCSEYGEGYSITAFVRFDDRNGNGHNTLSITGEIRRPSGRVESCGMIHDEISKHFPELRKFLKWHLTSTDGPLHYIPNTIYWTEQDKFDNARSSAVWPEASDKIFASIHVLHGKQDLEKALNVRLPGLMIEFKEAIEELGFIY